jgi:hypothetical protein
MSLIKSHRPSPWMLVAVAALSFALVGTAVAGPSAVSKLTKSKVKSIAKKQADKELKANVAGSHVNTADKATNADTAANANALGGRSLAQVQPVIAGNTSATVVSLGAGVDVVSTTITLAATSRINVVGSAELEGAAADERANCVLQRNGSTFGPSFETTFDDIGSDNEATLAAVSTQANVPAGTHTIAMRCTALTGTVVKDDAGINVTAVAN